MRYASAPTKAHQMSTVDVTAIYKNNMVSMVSGKDKTCTHRPTTELSEQVCHVRKPSEGRRPFTAAWIHTLHCPVIHTVAFIYPRNKLGPIYQLSVSRNSVFQDGISALLKLPTSSKYELQGSIHPNERELRETACSAKSPCSIHSAAGARCSMHLLPTASLSAGHETKTTKNS